MSTIASSNLFRLPTDLLIHCLVPQMNKLTGSAGVVNTADLPVSMRNVVRLSLTCKKMQAILNSPIFIRTLLTQLAKRFEKSEEFIASQMDTPSSRRWLWNYIQTHGYGRIYQAIQDIYAVAGKVIKDAKAAGLEIETAKREDTCPAPNPCFYQVKSGLFLLSDRIPDILATPFGQVKLVTVLSVKDSLPLTEKIFRCLKATFLEIFYLSDDRNNRVFEVADSDAPSFLPIAFEAGRKISERELNDQKGRRVVIVNRNASTMYIVKQVGDQILAPGEWANLDDREPVLVHAMWKMLERNRIGQDPLAREKIQAPAYVPPLPQFKNMQEIASFTIDLLEKLAEQELFPEDRRLSFPTKVLPLKSYNDAYRTEMLNRLAASYLKENTHWRVYACGFGNTISLQGKDIGPGLDLWLPEHSKPRDLKDLKVALDTVLTSLGLGWQAAQLKDFPGILVKQSEEDYFLFVKEQSQFPAEDVLIRVVADDLGIKTFIQCQSSWKDDSKVPYLWVKKDKMKQVSDALQLSIKA